MELSRWIAADLASLRQRLESGFVRLVPPAQLIHPVDGGGVAPVYVLWHLARHHDVAINGVLRQADEVLTSAWAERVGIDGHHYRGLAEAQDTELVTTLDPEAVSAYTLAVIAASERWLEAATFPSLDTVPASAAALERLGTPSDRFEWLYAMWDGKPVQFFLQWEAVGHGYVHLGELISLRNRLGLSPF